MLLSFHLWMKPKYKIMLRSQKSLAKLNLKIFNFTFFIFDVGKKYEIRLYAQKGTLHSTAVLFRVDMPETVDGCQDTETGQTYEVGEVSGPSYI